MGKTRIVQKFLRHHRSRFDTRPGQARRPVVAIQMPPAPTPRHLYEEILISMGGIFSQRCSASTLRHRIRILAHQLEVRMLLIDEIHAILAGTFREPRIILDAIPLLANDLRVPLVCVGTHEANQAWRTDQQLADRFEAMELAAGENDQAFHQLMASFASILPLRPPSDFRDPQVHQRIVSLTEGVLVRICRLMERAAVEAIRSGTERILLGSLTEDLLAGSLVSIADRRNRRIASR